MNGRATHESTAVPRPMQVATRTPTRGEQDDRLLVNNKDKTQRKGPLPPPCTTTQARGASGGSRPPTGRQRGDATEGGGRGGDAHSVWGGVLGGSSAAPEALCSHCHIFWLVEILCKYTTIDPAQVVLSQAIGAVIALMGSRA